MDKNKIQYENCRGVTQLALVVTAIIVFILACVTLNSVFNEMGLFETAEDTGMMHNEAKEREILETALMTDGQREKYINPEYNEREFLDELIKREIEGSKVKGDVAIVGEYAFEIDRSVPEIGRNLGKADGLIFPTVEATEELAENKSYSTITITALEEIKGIKKIEIWYEGEMIFEYSYRNVKTTITEQYRAAENGKYIIKACGELASYAVVMVDGIERLVEFNPDGCKEWKKIHSTTVTIKDVEDKIASASYYWTNSVVEPSDDKFTGQFKSGDTISQGRITGKYYLWVMLTSQSGKRTKWRSKVFYFDNQGPTITKFASEKYSETGITLSATAQDTSSGVVKFEFYIDDELKDTQTCKATTGSITRTSTITDIATGEHSCKVIVYDALDFKSTKTITGTTKVYVWEKWNFISKNRYMQKSELVKSYSSTYSTVSGYSSYRFDSEFGVFYYTGNSRTWTGPCTYYTNLSSGGGVIHEYIRSNKNSTLETNDCIINHYRITAVENPNATYTKGTTQYENVTSNYSNAYPAKGYQDGYYYVKTTSQ